MLRITQNSSAEAAISYFDEGLSKSDYFNQKGEVIGLWGGKAPEMLGLSNEVARTDFKALCLNINPQTGSRLTARNDTGRTVGYDFTFSTPKSVSILHALTHDPDIKRALNVAMTQAMQEVERHAETRVRKNGKYSNRRTDNLAWAFFTHEEARPVNGLPDPHLHNHCFVFNATYDPIETQWKAAQFRNIKANAPYYEAIFNNALAHELQRAGYSIEHTAHNFEIEGFSRELIEKFSRRTLEVEKKAKDLGLEFAEDIAAIGAKTRVNKRTGISKTDLEKEWIARLTPQEWQLIQNAKGNTKNTGWDESNQAGLAMEYALKHCLERKSVAGYYELMTLALKKGAGFVLKDKLDNILNDRTDLIFKDTGHQKIFSTKGTLSEEQQLIHAARKGKNTFLPINADYIFQNPELNIEQKEAVQHVLNSRDFITVVNGGAGTGKTWSVKEIAWAAKQKGISFHAFAPSSSASRETQQAEGFENATTLAELLQNETLQNKISDGIVWLDEAGLVGCKSLNRLIEITQKHNGRLLLTGDTRQHNAVERGDALRILEKFGGIKPATINKIQRQKQDNYKKAVKHLSEGQIEKGFVLLDEMGAIREKENFQDCVDSLATEYVRSLNSRTSVLVVAPTHHEGQETTTAIRRELKKSGKLGKEEMIFPIQRNLSFTDAEKGNTASYEIGQTVQFHQNAIGFVRGAKYDIIGKDDSGRIMVQSGDVVCPLPLSHASRFTVYEKSQLPLAAGDNIRITQNGFSNEKKRLNNSNILRVIGFDGAGNIKASTGKNTITLDKDYRNFTYGYYTTSPGAQGKSVNKVLILQTARSGKAACKEQFYVSASRGRFDVSIFTDDKERMLDAVHRSSERLSATELMNGRNSLQRTVDIRRKLTRLRLKGLEKDVPARSAANDHQIITKRPSQDGLQHTTLDR